MIIEAQNNYAGVIPLEAGEDELKVALARLAELPENVIPKPALLPSGSHFPNICPNPLFVGRDDDLKQLACWLKGGGLVTIGEEATTTGIGGIGKTQLANEFAHRYGQYFTGGVFWLSFAEPELIPSAVAACSDFEEAKPLEIKVKQVLSKWQSGIPRLLIFDNCEDSQLLVQWQPPTGGSRVLVTSRQRNWDPALEVKQLPLGLLKRAESTALLRGFLGDLLGEDLDLNLIAAELEDFPLALHMAGSFLRTNRHDFSTRQYLEILQQPPLLRHHLLNEEKFSPTGYDLDVKRTFDINVDKLNQERETDRVALDLLKRISCFMPGESVGRELLKKSIGEDIDGTVFEDGINRLMGLGLIIGDRAGAVLIHRLVVSFIQEAFPDDCALIEVEQAVLSTVSDIHKSGDPGKIQQILMHLKQLTDQAIKRGDTLAAGLANNLGYYLEEITDYPGARYYYEQALAIYRKSLGEEHFNTAISLNSLGMLLMVMGDYSGAQLYLEQALAIYRKVMGEEHTATIICLNNLGVLLKAMGDYRGARLYIEQVLALKRKTLGENHLSTAISLNNLGYLLSEIGDYAGARLNYEQALVIKRKTLGEEHPDIAIGFNNLGSLLREKGDYASSRSYYEQALVIKRKYLGDEHISTALSLNNLGILLQEMGDYGGAWPYLEQALAIRRKALGELHPDTAQSLNNLGTYLQAINDYSGARRYLGQALAILEKTLGIDHPSTMIVRENLEKLSER